MISSSTSFSANGNCFGQYYLDCTFTTNNRSSLSSSASFTSCIWSECEAASGGGIYLNVSDSSVTLTVTKGEFYSCKANPYYGGGILLEGIGDAQIKETLFYDCTAGGRDDSGGGGIQMWLLQNPPRIEHTSFVHCTSGNDGGGLVVRSSVVYQETCIKTSRFIQCESYDSGSSSGGGVIVWASNAAIGCSECLFSNCYSACDGGGFGFDVFSSSTFKDIPISSFSFFRDNSSPTGNDVSFGTWYSSKPLLFCFSTTSTSRVYPPGNDDNWLPQANMNNKETVLRRGRTLNKPDTSHTPTPIHSHPHP